MRVINLSLMLYTTTTKSWSRFLFKLTLPKEEKPCKPHASLGTKSC